MARLAADLKEANANVWLDQLDIMDNLGILYQNGFGVPKDYHQAREWV